MSNQRHVGQLRHKRRISLFLAICQTMSQTDNIDYFANVSRLTKMLNLTDEHVVFSACKAIFGDDIWLLNIVDRLCHPNAALYNVPPEDVPLISQYDIPIVNELVDELRSTDTSLQSVKLVDDSVARRSNGADNSVSSSQRLGVIGEQLVADTIRTLRPKFDVVVVSSEGHVADIHIEDIAGGVKYIVEVKNKARIMKSDIDKFNRDLEQTANGDGNQIGLFISLESDTIPGIGPFGIQAQPLAIYLTKGFFKPECLDIIFDYSPILTQRSVNASAQTVDYRIPPSVYSLVVNVQQLGSSLAAEIESLTAIQKSELSNVSTINDIIYRKATMGTIIKEILKEFGLSIGSSGDVMNEHKQLLRQWLKGRGKKVRKTDILEAFPILRTELSSMKLADIVRAYS